MLHPESNNPYRAPQTGRDARPLGGRQPASPDQLPWHRRGGFFSLVIYTHVACWIAFAFLTSLGAWGEWLGAAVLFLSSLSIIVLCGIAITGPVYLRGFDGRWWRTGWFDRVAAGVIGLVYLSACIGFVLQVVAWLNDDIVIYNGTVFIMK